MYKNILSKLIVSLFIISICSCTNEPPNKSQAGTPQTGSSVNVIDLGTLKQKIIALEQKKRAMSSECVTFSVRGEIVDRDASSVLLRGKAFPSNYDHGHIGALSEDGNIQVLNATNINRHGNNFHFEKAVYFKEKTTGTNLYGVPVPLRIYTTDVPDSVKKAQSEISKLDEQLSRFKKEYEAGYLSKKEEEFSKIKDNPQELVKYAQEHAAIEVPSSMWDALAPEKAYKRIIELNPKDADAHAALGNLYRNKGSLNEAKEEIGIALSLNPQQAEAKRLKALFDEEVRAERLAAIPVLIRLKIKEIPCTIERLEKSIREEEEENAFIRPSSVIDDSTVEKINRRKQENKDRKISKYKEDIAKKRLELDKLMAEYGRNLFPESKCSDRYYE